MKRFSTVAVLKVSPESLFAGMRDHLPALAGELPDIAAIEELSRDEREGRMAVVNRWTAARRVPPFLEQRLGAAEISWIDTGRWRLAELDCQWTIEPAIGDGAIACSGSTRFLPAMAGRGTRVAFEGALTIRKDFMASLAGPLEGPALALVESIATTTIPANFRVAAEAAARRVQPRTAA